MLTLLEQREKPEAMVGNIDVVGAVADRMSDASVAQFVAGVGRSRSAARRDRLAHAFQALVPEQDRQRQLLALAEKEVAAVRARRRTVVRGVVGAASRAC